jgi:hypothetical protein
MIIKNPTTTSIGEFNFDYVKYPGIKAGESVTVEQALGNYMKQTWGFLEVVEDELPLKPITSAQTTKPPQPTPSVLKNNPGLCPYCGRDCKIKAALIHHLKKCPEKAKLEAETVVKPEPLLPPTPMVGQPVTNSRPLTRSQMEDRDFGQIDGIIGTKTKDMIAGREQLVIQDGDQVSWYGDGATDDVSVTINKDKDFS